MALTDNMKGAVLMMGSMAAFTVNDAFLKSLSDELPLFQALFLRGLGLSVCLALMCVVLGQFRLDIGRGNWLLISWRALAEVLAAFFFLTALFNMPLANVSAILQALPLTVALGGAVFLGEPLGWRRMTAIAIGFCGVMLIIRPGGADFNSFALMAVAAVIAVTCRDLVVRRISNDVPSAMIALITAVAVTVASGLASAFFDWRPVSFLAGWQLAGSTFFVIGGYIFSVSAMRHGELSFVAPFRYTSLLVALVLGLVVFGDFPDVLTLFGALIVVATGLFTLWREHRLRQAKSPA